jgi:putative tricarboxylic transport membrane protein
MNRDLVCGIVMLGLAIGYYILVAGIPDSSLADPIGPQGLPRSYAIALGILSLLLIGRSLLRGRTGQAAAASEQADRSREWIRLKRASVMLAIGVVYVLLLPWLGYAVSLAILIAVTASYQGVRARRGLAVVAVLGAAVLWALFAIVLRIPEPAGIWPSFL